MSQDTEHPEMGNGMFLSNGFAFPEIRTNRLDKTIWWVTAYFDEKEINQSDQDLLTLMLRQIHNKKVMIGPNGLHRHQKWCISIPAPTDEPIVFGEILASAQLRIQYLLRLMARGELTINRSYFNSGT
ncbi:uncharacterized protein N7511_008621 [Penicillium nucicola]|uniref:uncharacterized protein n=1 Tax=Penicillium nucicola TaxID=1850975 RepID=UPI0025454F16|nr:uncharacterized protein N7511_008621 [Penicillium nucicola]KAJ5746925.1 hypothetical protein N7511_008621 [Penicillium nucicola]